MDFLDFWRLGIQRKSSCWRLDVGQPIVRSGQKKARPIKVRLFDIGGPHEIEYVATTALNRLFLQVVFLSCPQSCPRYVCMGEYGACEYSPERKSLVIFLR